MPISLLLVSLRSRPHWDRLLQSRFGKARPSKNGSTQAATRPAHTSFLYRFPDRQSRTQHWAQGRGVVDQNDEARPWEQAQLLFCKHAIQCLSGAFRYHKSHRRRGAHQAGKSSMTCKYWNTKVPGFARTFHPHDPKPSCRSSNQGWKRFLIPIQ